MKRLKRRARITFAVKAAASLQLKCQKNNAP
jgi:hypothetical protein